MMGAPGKGATYMRRHYESSDWIEQRRRDAKAGRLFLACLFGIATSMIGLYSFLLLVL